MPQRAERPAADPEGHTPDDARRRAPFATNPAIGVRGQRTRQRILDGALHVFGEVGYDQASIETIANAAGCSRVSFYQYFSSKEDVFRHLATQVARQLNASTEWLEPVTADDGGWQALRAWVARFSEVHERYAPVFHAFRAAAAIDTSLEHESVRTASGYVTGLGSRVTGTSLASRDLGPVLDLLRESLPRTLDDTTTLQAAAPRSFPDGVILDAYCDAVHRTLFGLRPGVNVHRHRVPRPPKLPFGPVMQMALDERDAGEEPASEARHALLDAARRAFIRQGFHATRVDDVVTAAGVSHGAFYRYFENKDEIARLLAAKAIQSVSVTLAEIPDLADDTPAGKAALRRWLRAYNRAQADEAAMIRVWSDARRQDAAFGVESAPVVDWGRRRIARALAVRGFGDPDIDAAVLLSVLDTFGARTRPGRSVDAAALIIERGFLGR